NLTTVSNGAPLETDGMIYLNATSDGRQVRINKDIPLYIEMPTAMRKPGMMVYKGVRDEQGDMNWVSPKPVDDFLTTVDIQSLDFLPEAFQWTLELNMPYKEYKIATKQLAESLYYQLAVSKVADLTDGLIATDYNEPHFNKNKEVKNGAYTDQSFVVEKSGINRADTIATDGFEGIDPAAVKAIKSEKYQNTFIATREFEARLKLIFNTCNNDILDLYVNNLEQNLYELDSIAATMIDEMTEAGHCIEAFKNFAAQRRTNVRQADKYANLLKGYYERQRNTIRQELELQRTNRLNSLQNESDQVQKVADEYKKLLFKRESYRMETYGFQWSDTGWINIDTGETPKGWSVGIPEGIVVSNGAEFDRVYTYFLYTGIKSLYRLNSKNKVDFYSGSGPNEGMIIPKEGTAVLLAIGYKGESAAIAVAEHDLGKPLSVKLTLAASTLKQVKNTIARYDRYGNNNSIKVDQEYQYVFYREQQRQEALLNEAQLLAELMAVAFPCGREE
ncbi:MAG: hypothetical protein JNM00_02870, partial [Flavobacteriales bacterium]|nr:hypothetical protein [Flavobacteriales bacterium]